MTVNYVMQSYWRFYVLVYPLHLFYSIHFLPLTDASESIFGPKVRQKAFNKTMQMAWTGRDGVGREREVAAEVEEEEEEEEVESRFYH